MTDSPAVVPTDTSEILLRIPARAPYARVVRVGAAALALRQNMGFGEIDDLRLAIDETMILLLDRLEELETEIEVIFRVTADRFELEATRHTGVGFSDAAVHRYDAIVSGLVDECRIDPALGRVTLVKAPTAPLD